jgi:tetratricopeptide (TPR) repeat protein
VPPTVASRSWSTCPQVQEQLGAVLLDAGAFRDAARAFEGAARLYALHLGDAHPRVGRARHSLGLAQDARGRPASAALDIEQALPPPLSY